MRNRLAAFLLRAARSVDCLTDVVRDALQPCCPTMPGQGQSQDGKRVSRHAGEGIAVRSGFGACIASRVSAVARDCATDCGTRFNLCGVGSWRRLHCVSTCRHHRVRSDIINWPESTKFAHARSLLPVALSEILSNEWVLRRVSAVWHVTRHHWSRMPPTLQGEIHAIWVVRECFGTAR